MRLETDPSEVLFAAHKILSYQGRHKAAHILRNLVEHPETDSAPEEEKERPLSPEQALSQFISSGSAKGDMQDWRNLALSQGSKLIPTVKAVEQAKLLCYPEGMVFTHISGEVPLQSLLNHTFQRLVTLHGDKVDQLPASVKEIKSLVKAGMDGMGGHSQYKQGYTDDTQVGSDGQSFMACVVPIHLDDGEAGLIWENEVPNSTFFCRVLKFAFLKETKQLVQEFYENLQEQIDNLTPTPCITPSSRKILVRHKVCTTMVDGKICGILTDTGNRRCHVCRVTYSRINDIDYVLGLQYDEDRLTFGASILHAYMRIFDNLMHISCKQDIKQYEVSKKSWEATVVQARKFLIQTEFKKEMNLLVDFPRPNGGTSTDGNTARKFFKEHEKGADILQLDRLLVRRLSVILRTLSCRHPIDADKFEIYAIDTARLYVTHYSWYPMAPTLHKILIHGAAFVRKSPCAVAALSEEAQESLNKVFRNFREHFTGKISRLATNEDIFKRLSIFSGPIISSLRMKNRKNEVELDDEVKALLLSWD